MDAVHISVQQNDRRDLGSSSGQVPEDVTNPKKTDNLDTNLNLILRKMHDLEDKIEQLERKINQQDPIMSSSRFLHSSPARSSKSARKTGLHRVGHATHQEVSDLSDEEESRFSSQPSGSHLSCISDTEVSDVQPSLNFLKQNGATQRKVQKQLLKLQGQSRSTVHRSGKSLKLGLHRAGDNAVKVEIPRPHHHCFRSVGETFQSTRTCPPSRQTGLQLVMHI